MLAIPPSKEDPPSDDRVDGGGAPDFEKERVKFVQKSGDEEEAFESVFHFFKSTTGLPDCERVCGALREKPPPPPPPRLLPIVFLLCVVCVCCVCCA